MVEQKMRWRKIKKWGNSLVLVYSKSDIQDFGIKKGDWADISDQIIVSANLKKLKEEAKK